MQFRELLMQHMQRFKFSMFGALQWKRDMADYQEAAARLEVQRVTEAFDQVLCTVCLSPLSVSYSPGKRAFLRLPCIQNFELNLNA